MTFKEYIPLAQRTNADLGSELLNSVHMTLGLFSETYEMFDVKDEVNLGEEIADKLWYLAGYITVNNLDLDLEFKTTRQQLFINGDGDSTGASMVYYESELADYDKKWLAYGKEKNIDKVKEAVKNLFISYNNLILSEGVNPSQIMQNNIDKLRVRFPDKFTSEHANNRDLEAERVELEK
jgi:hypothetical protein